MKTRWWAAAVAAVSTASSVSARPVATGVYDCFGRSMAAGRSLDVSEGARAARTRYGYFRIYILLRREGGACQGSDGAEPVPC